MHMPVCVFAEEFYIRVVSVHKMYMHDPYIVIRGHMCLAHSIGSSVCETISRRL